MTNDPAEPAPFAEARGPHLPDAVTAIGAYVWSFVLLAVARLVWFVRESPPAAPYDVASVLTYAAGVVPSVVAILLPGALLLRHPDAADRARTLLFGAVLFAVVEGMRVLNPPLQPVFEQLTPGDEATPFLVPLALLYNAAIGLLGAYALANMGIGLARARRYEDPAGASVVGAIMIVAVSLVAVGGIVSVSQLPLDQIEFTPTVIVYLPSTILLSVLFAAAWAYLAAAAIRGARAGELPEAGWAAAATGGGLVIAAYTVRSVILGVTPSPDLQPLFLSIHEALSVTVALGYLGLLLGMLLGLPSLDQPEEVDEGDEGEEDDDDAWGDELDPSTSTAADDAAGPGLNPA